MLQLSIASPSGTRRQLLRYAPPPIILEYVF